MRKKVSVDDRMQQGYVYWRTETVGRHFAPAFAPQLTPGQMLKLGVFGGKYMTDCRTEFPDAWFAGAKLCAERHDPRLNCFGVNASQSLADWRRSGWIHKQDPRGGSSGFAVTTWAAEPPTMRGRFAAGGRSRGMWPPYGKTASRATVRAGRSSGRPCCTGPTTADESRKGVACGCW